MKKIVGGIKDENGIFVPQKPAQAPSEPIFPKQDVVMDLSIDNLLHNGLIAIAAIMRDIRAEITLKGPSRNTVANLKDVMTMLRELKKDEKEILDEISDEDLEKLLKK